MVYDNQEVVKVVQLEYVVKYHKYQQPVLILLNQGARDVLLHNESASFQRGACRI